MSEDIVNAAGQASRQIKLAICEMRLKIETMDTTSNALGVLNDRWMLLASLDEIDRCSDRIRRIVLATHWPTQAEYAEI